MSKDLSKVWLGSENICVEEKDEYDVGIGNDAGLPQLIT